MAGSLFDRLTLGEAGMKMDEDESIRLHIGRMFTARQGSVPTLPDDYGLPDLNDLTLSKYELSQKNCQIMAACISKYEKRLVNSKVSESPTSPGEPFTQRFLITAEKYDEDGRIIPWKWEVTLENGRIRERL
jgi:type VI secretion system protein